MPVFATSRFYQIREFFERVLRSGERTTERTTTRLRATTVNRVFLLVIGLLKAANAAPARIAFAAETLGISSASVESIGRRLRRIVNDPNITPETCFHPLAKQWLAHAYPELLARGEPLVLAFDPSCQDARLVLLSLGVWYRGRALPLVWEIWKGQVPIRKLDQGEDFWKRVATVLETAKQVLADAPERLPIVVLADRAFGCPVFTDKVKGLGWHFLVRVQDQTRLRTRKGRIVAVRDLVRSVGDRAHVRGEVFKKQGWRAAHVVAYWGRRHEGPLCLVSDLPGRWSLVALYRRRYGIEASFRDLKSGGWHWEQGQVRDIGHVRVLLVGIAIATWLTVSLGAHEAQSLLAQAANRQRRTPGPEAKLSLFQLGRRALERFWMGRTSIAITPDGLSGWAVACCWNQQVHNIYARTFVFRPHLETVRP